jgi:hypothetical protein
VDPHLDAPPDLDLMRITATSPLWF